LGASVTETVLIGRAENARVLMIDLHRSLGERLFTLTNPQLFNEAVRRSRFCRDYSLEARSICAVSLRLTSGSGMMLAETLWRTQGVTSPEEFASRLQGITSIGGRYLEKVWIYLM
jgi:hypothetical protein